MLCSNTEARTCTDARRRLQVGFQARVGPACHRRGRVRRDQGRMLFMSGVLLVSLCDMGAAHGEPGQCREQTAGGRGRATAPSALPAQTRGPSCPRTEGSRALKRWRAPRTGALVAGDKAGQLPSDGLRGEARGCAPPAGAGSETHGKCHVPGPPSFGAPIFEGTGVSCAGA